MNWRITQKKNKHGEKIPKRYFVTIELGRDPLTGERKRIRRTVNGTVTDAKRVAKQLIKELQQDEIAPDAAYQITLSDLIDQWLEHIKVNRETRTYDYYSYCAKRIKQHLGHIELSDLKRRHVQVFIDRLGQPGERKDGKPDKPLSTRTIKMHHSTLHAALAFANQLQMIGRNPASDVILPRQRATSEPIVLTQDQIDQLLAAAEGTRWYALWYTAISTGLRTGELLGLWWDDVDWKNRALHIRRALKRTSDGRHYMGGLKTHESRIVYLRRRDMDALEAHKHRQDIAKQLQPRWPQPKHVFVNDEGDWIYMTVPSRMLSRTCLRLGLPPATMHDLRHTHGSMLLAEGWDIAAVSERLGHASITTTTRTYLHAIPGAQQRYIMRDEDR